MPPSQPPPRPASARPQRPLLASMINPTDPEGYTYIFDQPQQSQPASNSSPVTAASRSPSPTAIGINMPSLRRATEQRRTRKRSAAQSVDLDGEEADNEAPAASSAGPRRKRQDTGTTEHRRRRSGQGSSRARPRGEPIVIEDLESNEDEEGEKNEEAQRLKETLQRQREEQVKAAQEADKEPPRLNRLQCVICMDSFSDMTATSCGHIFCHECLISALKASEARRLLATGAHGKKSQCPVCRTNLMRSKKGDVIPLLIMKQGLATQPRRVKA